jgi:hypothetical protein
LGKLGKLLGPVPLPINAPRFPICAPGTFLIFLSIYGAAPVPCEGYLIGTGLNL